MPLNRNAGCPPKSEGERPGAPRQRASQFQQAETRPVLAQRRRRHCHHKSAGALAGRLARDCRGRKNGRPRRLRIHPADRALEGVWRRARRPHAVLRDLYLRRGAVGDDRADHDLFHRACAGGASGIRGEGAGDGGSCQRRPRRAQHRRGMESGRVRHVRTRARRARPPLRAGARMVRRDEPDLHLEGAVRLSAASFMRSRT